MNRFFRAATALAALLGATTAFAGSTAEATLDALTITLVDLDPGDGIAPSISFAAGASRATSVVFQPFGVFDDDTASGAGPWSGVAAAVNLSLGRAAGTIQGAAADGSGAMLHAFGHAAEPGPPLGSAVQYQAQVWAPYAAAGAFVLSPRTAVTISADVRLSTITQSSIASHDSAIAGANLFLHDSGDVVSLSCESFIDRQCSKAESFELSRSFSNHAGTSAEVTFQVWAQAAGYSRAASAVPEPAVSALLIAGLCGIGGVTRMRRRR